MNQSDIRMRQNVCRRLSAARRRQKYEPGLRTDFKTDETENVLVDMWAVVAEGACAVL